MRQAKLYKLQSNPRLLFYYNFQVISAWSKNKTL